MSATDYIYNKLSANTEINALASGGIKSLLGVYKTIKFPAIVFHVVSESPVESKFGSAGIDEVNVSVSCFSENRLTLQEMAARVRILLDRDAGTIGQDTVQSIQYTNQTEEIDPKGMIIGKTLQFKMRYVFDKNQFTSWVLANGNWVGSNLWTSTGLWNSGN